MAHAARYAGDKVDEAGGGASQAEGSAAQRPKRLWDDIWTLQYSRWAVLQCAQRSKACYQRHAAGLQLAGLP